ncbi:5'/3'-nucleotidase SurE [Caldisalinibacter kiritimatiensis]|uniref:5'-nucleotidase SurE n=1 Tax=Caldisalinibacter kiritimatiensis TaxID=1304284 RepID=R1AV84_9FIRM|nr:5'/3'-nucleotidase SurE [Caldisalinibacter kiritimatiensis]EOD01093.1 5-nucleotidase SurE [Caldisalinibacter kiritimatiensis]
MNILVTNDDGINAIGIRKLANELKRIGSVTVIAPDRERSATGHAITMHHPLRINKVDNYANGIEAWNINGTPSDCVKIGIESLMKAKPDLVVSGINNGPNLGTDVIYSGTVSAAIEGGIHNIPSIAISVAGKKGELNYESATYYSCKIVNLITKYNNEQNKVFNVNFPSISPDNIKGIRVTELGIRRYSNQYEERKDPMGKSYYWLSGKLLEIQNKNESDVTAIENNYISITPLHFDLTNYQFIKKMQNWELDI